MVLSRPKLSILCFISNVLPGLELWPFSLCRHHRKWNEQRIAVKSSHNSPTSLQQAVPWIRTYFIIFIVLCSDVKLTWAPSKVIPRSRHIKIQVKLPIKYALLAIHGLIPVSILLNPQHLPVRDNCICTGKYPRWCRKPNSKVICAHPSLGASYRHCRQSVFLEVSSKQKRFWNEKQTSFSLLFSNSSLPTWWSSSWSGRDLSTSQE